MNGFLKLPASVALGVLFILGPVWLYAAPPPDSCQALAVQLSDQNKALSGELRRVHRELAALRADLDEPGLKEIMAGIGYILGLFGVAAFVASRRKE